MAGATGLGDRVRSYADAGLNDPKVRARRLLAFVGGVGGAGKALGGTGGGTTPSGAPSTTIRKKDG